MVPHGSSEWLVECVTSKTKSSNGECGGGAFNVCHSP